MPQKYSHRMDEGFVPDTTGSCMSTWRGKRGPFHVCCMTHAFSGRLLLLLLRQTHYWMSQSAEENKLILYWLRYAETLFLIEICTIHKRDDCELGTYQAWSLCWIFQFNSISIFGNENCKYNDVWRRIHNEPMRVGDCLSMYNTKKKTRKSYSQVLRQVKTNRLDN